jgi:hypothetical protein
MGMSLRRIIKEEIDDLQWIRDIKPKNFEIFEKRLRDFINKTPNWLGNVGITIEPINERYGDTQEIGRVWMDEYDDVFTDNIVASWYWDLLVDYSQNNFIVELYEKHADSYEALEFHRFEKISNAIAWIIDTIAEE